MGKWRIITDAGYFAAVRPGCEAQMELSIWHGLRRVVVHGPECSSAGHGCLVAGSLADAVAYVDRAVMEEHFHAPVLEAPC